MTLLTLPGLLWAIWAIPIFKFMTALKNLDFQTAPAVNSADRSRSMMDTDPLPKFIPPQQIHRALASRAD